MRYYHYITYITAVSVILGILSTEGCSTGPGNGNGDLPAVNQDAVRAVPMPIRRVPLYKTDTLPAGDVIKRWRWDTPWEITNTRGDIIRRMYSPDSFNDATKTDGPHITVIQDPLRGTIYEAYFVQKTDKLFNLPMTLYFFATSESQAPLFALPLTDSSTTRCQGGRVSRGSIQYPGVPRVVFEAAQWVGIGWHSTTYKPC